MIRKHRGESFGGALMGFTIAVVVVVTMVIGWLYFWYLVFKVLLKWAG